MWTLLRRRTYKLGEKLKRSWVKRRHVAEVLAGVPKEARILEIGGGYNPRYTRPAFPNVYHLDHASTEDLRTKYAADPTVADRIDRIQPIDFVFDGRPIETLVPPELRFDVIYGSHVLEHQVDLVGHLQSLRKLLAPGGRVIEMVPDLRTCFDALRLPTVTSDVIAAHLHPSAVHRGKQMFDALSRELRLNHGFRMSEADFDGAALTHSLADAWAATQAAERPGASYVDVHAWTFTPESFRLLMIELRLLGLIELVPSWVSPQYGNQFCAVLEPCALPRDAMPPDEVQALEAERHVLARRLRVH